ncbi:MAG: TrmO family methyltransferase [Promethearchaeota archaeon]
MNITLSPIGTVEKKEGQPIRLLINPEHWPATLHVDKFSHLHIIWWATDLDTPQMRQHLQDVPPCEDAPLSGVFASRSPARPNLLCLSIVKLETVEEDGMALVVDHMDANDGTPIVDIKPYMPSSDRVDDAFVPSWFENLKKRYTR